VFAPIKKGDVVGCASVYVKGVLEGKINLVANCNVDKLTFIDYVKNIAKTWAF
jgi:hypothetical protein